jgi:hypothetical protein
MLRTDASGVGLGAVLTQIQDGKERVIAYHSRKLNPAEVKYPVHERELLGVVEAARVWRHYLWGREFTIKTDNWANKYLNTQPRLDPRRQAKWMEFLQEYDFVLEHIPGKQNVVADALSRRADYMLNALVYVQRDEEFMEELSMDAEKDDEYQKYYTAANTASIKHPGKQKRQDVVIKEKRLYIAPEARKGKLAKPMRLYVPAGTLRQRVLCEAHDVSVCGHLGRDKTLERLKRNYWWPGISADVRTMSCMLRRRSVSLELIKWNAWDTMCRLKGLVWILRKQMPSKPGLYLRQ